MIRRLWDLIIKRHELWLLKRQVTRLAKPALCQLSALLELAEQERQEQGETDES